MTWRIAGAAVLAALTALFLYANRHDIPATSAAAAQASAPLLIAAAALSVGCLLNYAAFYRASYRALGLRLTFGRALRMSNAAQFLNMAVINSGGMAGVGLFVRDASSRRQDRGRTISAYLLVALLGHGVFVLVLAVAMTLAAVNGELGRVQLAASAIFVAYTAAFAGLLIAAARSRAALRWLHRRPEAAQGWVLAIAGRRPGPKAARSSDDAADELYDALHLILTRPASLAVPAAHAVIVEAAGVASLWLCLRAFGIHAGIEAPLIGYAMGVLFSIIGFLPAGLGFAEAGIGLALSHFGYAAPKIALVVITYRLFEVWVPFAAGALSLRGSLSRVEQEP